MSDFDAIRVSIQGNAEDLRRAARSAVSSIRDVAQETRRANVESRASEIQTRRNASAFADLTRKQEGAAQSIRNFSVGLRTVGWTAAIAGTAPLAAGLVDIGAGATAAGAALAPLAGSVAVLPGLFAAGAQGMGVWSLATDGLSKAMAGNKKALEELTPAAREFLMTLRNDFGPEIKKLRATAQADLFPGLLKGLKAAEPALKPLNKIVGDTATKIGDLATSLGQMVGSKAWQKDIATIGARNVKVIGNLGDAGLHLADALRNIIITAGPLLDWMTKLVDKGATAFDQWTKQARANGNLADFFRLVKERIQQTLDILGGLGRTLFNVFKAAQPLADALMNALVGVSGHLADITGSVSGQNHLRAFFDDAKQPLEALGKLLGSLVAAIFDLAHRGQAVFTQLANTLRVDVLPVLHDALAAIATGLLPHIITLLGSVGRLLHALLPGLKPLLEALGTIVGLVSKIVDGITSLTQVLPGVTKLIPTLAVTAGVLASWRTLVSLSRAVMFGGAAGGALTGLAGGAAAGAAGGAAAQSARNFQVLTKAIGGGGAAGFASRLLPKLAPLGRVAGPVGATAAFLASPENAGLTKAPDLKPLIEQATSGKGTVREMAKAVDELATNWHHLAFEASPKAAANMNAQAEALKGSIQPARNVLSALKLLADGGGKSMDLLKQDFKNALREIQVAQQAGVISSEQATNATSQAYGAMATAIFNQMKKAGKFTQDGMDQITKLVQHEFSVLGIHLTATQAQRYGSGNDTLTGKPLSGAPLQGHATGGYIGSPGERGTDDVPVVLGRGEAVLNRHQQAPVEAAMQAVYGMGLGDLFARERTPHYMASGGFAGLKPGIAGATRRVLNRFPGLQVTSTTGGTHAPGSYHYLGEAADIAGDSATMNTAAAWIKATMGAGLTEGIHNPNLSIKFGKSVSPSFWGASTWAGHANHIHMAVAGALKAMGLGGGSIKTPRFPGGLGILSALGQGALSKTARAANGLLAGAGGAGGGDAGSADVKGAYGFDQLKALWISAGGPASAANIMAHVALAESSGNPRAHNASGATGLWQILGAVVPGNLFDPLVNARNAVAKWRAGGLHPWDASRSSWSRYLARGGFVGKRMAGGGFVAHAAGAGDSIIGLADPLPKSKKKAKKKARGPQPVTKLNPDNGRIETHSPSTWRTLANARARRKYLKSHQRQTLISSTEGHVPQKGQQSSAAEFTDTNTQHGDLTVNEQAFLDFFDGHLAMADLDTPFVAFDPSLPGDVPFDPATGLPPLHNPANLDDDLLWAGRKDYLLEHIYADRKARNAPVSVQGRIATMVKQARDDLQRLQQLHDAKQVAAAPDTSIRDSLISQQRDTALATAALQGQQLGVLSGFASLLPGRLVGSFARGTLSVPQDGIARVHEGEAILPRPDGPYGNQISSPLTTNASHNIEVHLHGDAEPFMRKVDVLVDGKIQRAQQIQGRRQRLFATAGVSR